MAVDSNQLALFVVSAFYGCVDLREMTAAGEEVAAGEQYRTYQQNMSICLV